MSDESKQISQDEIDRLLSQPKPPRPASAGDKSSGEPRDEVSALGHQEPAVAHDAATSSAAHQAAPFATQMHAPAGPAAPPAPGAAFGSLGSALPTSDIDFLFKQAEQALASVEGPPPAPSGVSPFKLVDFGGAPASTDSATLDLLRDVELDLKIELGRTHMYLEDVLRLSKGAVVPLDRLAGDPVDIYVNGRLIARGEVLILNDNFCVRVAELMAGETAGAAT
jgi:flagellar motor switch protein FliN/FliY